MILADSKLKEREKNNNPIRVGVVGAGVVGKNIVNLITKHVPGMTVTVISNRTGEKAISNFNYAGIDNVKLVDSAAKIDEAVASGNHAVTEDYKNLCACNSIDIVVEVTGTIFFGCEVLLEAFENGKDVVTFNAELDSTVGPMLQVYAEKAGVIYSGSDGDQPGVTMNLYRYVKGLGLNPLLLGNIKGLHDPYRNPDTQAAFAEAWQFGAEKATCFADGTKLCMEQTCVANATSMKVAKRGMLGYEHRGHVDDMKSMYDLDMLREQGGIIEYALGAQPGPGVFIYATCDDPLNVHQLKFLKMGEGPLYSFYTPYHLCFFDIPSSIVRIVDFRDPVYSFGPKPTVDVISLAKKDLKAGEMLDGPGYYTVYGECENSNVVQAENLVPIGLADQVKLKNNISKDGVITFDDIEYSNDVTLFRLYKEQVEYYVDK